MTSMTRGNPTWGKTQTPAWRFRVRGKNHDGEMVTLGSYENEVKARARYRELVEEGYYSLLRVQSLKLPTSDSED